MAVKCDYRGGRTKFSHKEDAQLTEIHECSNCKHLPWFYFYKESGTKAKVSFIIDIGSKSYMWINNYISNSSTIYDISIDGSKSGIGGMLIEFPKVMNINPDNVKERLAFYLPFI